ncbi:MAG: aminotransferase class I/II-fold pyridoxal phosphate-dependent enzyme [Actinobacteria bacterium]|nr:aminotransferase class I/II-fold pyridoxal phosphate-dependent enzyme [Actinomycetota bacterium]
MLEQATYERVRNLRGIKWRRYGDDVISAWVADMDIPPVKAVAEAMIPILQDGDLGYNIDLAAQLLPAYAAWQDRHHGWNPDVERLRTFTGSLQALEAALWLRTDPGDGIVVFSPIYFPFLNVIEQTKRRIVDVRLDDETWRLDADRLESAIDSTTRMILFCQPHNPIGRVFDEAEVSAVAEMAEKHDLLVVTDEIWGDLTLTTPHRPLATMDERLKGRLITLGSASKTFSLAGLRCAVAHIDDERLTEKLDALPMHLLGSSSTVSAAGTLAAWTHGDEWVASMRDHLRARCEQLQTRLAADLPEVTMTSPEATYFGWLDFRRTHIADDPSKHLLNEAKVALSPGITFGAQGAGHARINFATSAEIIDDIIDRIVELVRR